MIYLELFHLTDLTDLLWRLLGCLLLFADLLPTLYPRPSRNLKDAPKKHRESLSSIPKDPRAPYFFISSWVFHDRSIQKLDGKINRDPMLFYKVPATRPLATPKAFQGRRRGAAWPDSSGNGRVQLPPLRGLLRRCGTPQGRLLSMGVLKIGTPLKTHGKNHQNPINFQVITWS